MKKIGFFFLLFACVKLHAQTTDIFDPVTLRARINSQIAPNGTRSITPAVLNKIFNGVVNIQPGFSSGLTPSTAYPYTVKLGGNLSQHTIISGLSNYDFSLNNLRNFQLSAQNIYLPGVTTGTSGSLQMLVLDSATGKVYKIPIYAQTAGTPGGTTQNLPPQWGYITGSLTAQTDLMDSLRARQYKLPLGTLTQYLRGNQTLGNFYSDVRAIGDTAYASKAYLNNLFTGTTNTSGSGGTWAGVTFSPPLMFNSSTHTLGIDVLQNVFDANRIQTYPVNGVPLNGQTMVFNAAEQRIDWMTIGSGSGGVSDGNNYVNRFDYVNGHLQLDRVGMSGFDINFKDSLESDYPILTQSPSFIPDTVLYKYPLRQDSVGIRKIQVSLDTTGMYGGVGGSGSTTQVQADFSQSITTAPDFIKNKPKPHKQEFTGTSLGQFTVSFPVVRTEEIEMQINGVAISDNCFSITANTFLLNQSCLGYTLTLPYTATIKYKSYQ